MTRFLLVPVVGMCAVMLGCAPAAEEGTGQVGAGGAASSPAGNGGRGGSAAVPGSGGVTGTGGSGGDGGSVGGVTGTGGGGAGAATGGAGGAAMGAGSGGTAGTGMPGADAGADGALDPGSTPMGVVPSPACAGGALMPGPDGYQSIMSGGRMRRFLIRVPRSYDGKKPLGLIFALHGGNANGMSFETRIASIRAAVGERAVYVYPDGLAAAGGMITWARDHKDDLAFMDTIVGWLKDKVCFDTARLFAMGQSSGAYFSHTIGCHRAGVFRAVASNGGGARENEFVGCNGKQAAAWISNGAGDAPHLPWARKAREEWVKINGCTMAGAPKTDPAPCVSYQGCKSGYPVHYCENPGGHDIPGYMPMGLANFFFGNFDK